ncbi:MAG TPA: 23S rRNA (pseudouridine(1915)-N(3))-methyltransferase RlmH [Terriglobia bacterium]|nr:23S rRNA (pseudouridine(1915)-N(3))-methyltransferase RlmH [Terriglobia bacterium]
MKIMLIWTAKTKDPRLSQMVADYAQRIRHYLELSVLELKPGAGNTPERILEGEESRLLEKLNDRDFLVLLDPKGEELTSVELADWMGEFREYSGRRLVFVVGGHYGVGARVKSRAHRLLSLSRMTLTHEMARVVLLEQIYRALTLIHRVPYHK